MSKEAKTAQRFLEEISQGTTKITFETLNVLTEELENKSDPSPTEMKIVESLYQFMEKLKILEYNLRSYVNETNENLPGNVLNNLYNKAEPYGTSAMFD
jgi:hypothetical protein